MTVTAINKVRKIAFNDDGSISRMQHFVDRFGDETDDVGEAISAIALLPNGRWAVIDFAQYELAYFH